MKKLLGTFFALLFLIWGLLAVFGGIGAGRPQWIFLGVVLAGFGCIFLPAVAVLWQRDEPAR